MTNTHIKKTRDYITRENERELVRKYQQTKDNVYLEQLIEAHSGYIQKIATEQYTKFKKQVEYEDLIQEGRIGFIKAINKFDLDKTFVNPKTNKVVSAPALLTYAHNYILSEMQNLFYKSNATHIPTHTQRAIQFNVKNEGCNTEERKNLAKLSMKADSLSNYIGDNINPNNYNYSYNTKEIILNQMYTYKQNDSTFENSTVGLFSTQNQKAIQMLSELEWKIIQFKLGLIKNEEGIIAKSSFIAEELGLTIKEVDKIFKKAKQTLTKNLVKGN